MPQIRQTQTIIKGVPTIEGAGVHLSRVFGHRDKPNFDPFLLFDDFRSRTRDNYIKGFPWHPHRGIETVTYMIEGSVEHGDSMGNKGVVSAGDVQWMTAGSGIIHQEMPRGNMQGAMGGFQLWLNLPASKKLMEPRYQEIKKAEIPVVNLESGVSIRVICGKIGDCIGPVKDIVTQPEFLDITIPAGSKLVHASTPGHTQFAYVIKGLGLFDDQRDSAAENESLVQYSDGDQVVVSAKNQPVRFLLISGKPISEPVAWRGPIVMNTYEELDTAFKEYSDGTFIKHG